MKVGTKVAGALLVALLGAVVAAGCTEPCQSLQSVCEQCTVPRTAALCNLFVQQNDDDTCTNAQAAFTADAGCP
jgi:hypothetical protein